MLQVTIAIYTALLLVAIQAQAASLQDSVDSFLANKAAVLVDNPGATAMVCLAAHSLIPTTGNRAINLARHAGSSLLESMTRENDRAGWTLGTYTLPANCGPGTYRPFGRAECNPKSTFYAYYNALAILCLSRLGNTLGESRFSEAAQASVAYWLKIGARSNDCQKCWYFWTSDASADRNRYVRNISSLMGWVVAEVDKRGGIVAATGVGESEAREIEAGNYGYLGRLDPQYRANVAHESQRTENHMPLVALSLYRIGTITEYAEAKSLATNLMRHWLTCSTTWCKSQPCSVWAGRVEGCTNSLVVAPCLLRSIDSEFRAACDRATASLSSYTTFQLWAINEDSIH